MLPNSETESFSSLEHCHPEEPAAKDLRRNAFSSIILIIKGV